MCKCARAARPDCGDACLVVGAPLPFFHKRNPGYWQKEERSFSAPLATANHNGMSEFGSTGTYLTSTDRLSAYEWSNSDKHAGQFGQVARHLAADSNTAITINCGEYCADVLAALESPDFEEQLASNGVSAVVNNKGNIISYPTVTADTEMVTVNNDGSVTNTHTAGSHTQEEYDDYKNATTALAVFCALLLIALIFLWHRFVALTARGSSGTVKFGDTDTALDEASSYEV